MKMLIIAAAAMAGGAAGLFLVLGRHEAGRREPKSGRTAGHHREEENGDHGQGADPGGRGADPLYRGGFGGILAHRERAATLTACVFGVCGFENGVMGWIKTTKEKQAAEAARTSGSGHQTARRNRPRTGQSRRMWAFKEALPMTENQLRQKVADIINAWVGATKGSAKHLRSEIYNSH